MSTHNIPFFKIKRKITLNYPKSAAMGFFKGTQSRVRNSRGKRAISVRVTRVQLYFFAVFGFLSYFSSEAGIEFFLI